MVGPGWKEKFAALLGTILLVVGGGALYSLANVPPDHELVFWNGTVMSENVIRAIGACCIIAIIASGGCFGYASRNIPKL